MDELDGPYPILNRLAAQSVNVDELDYLAKRLEGFCESEKSQFQAMASKLCLSNTKDLINLTFCCQQATVVTDFSNLEGIGKSHSLTVNGGSMPMEEFKQVDGLAVALDLIKSGAGIVTPYGVVFDNGMELEQLYTGGPFPQYLYGDPLLTLGVPIQPEIGGPVETAWLYLPAPERRISRTLCRIGIINNDAAYFIEDSSLPSKIFKVLERPNDAILELNRMCQAIDGLDPAVQTKLEAVMLMAQPESASEIRQLAENLGQFDFVPRTDAPEQASQITELGYVAYHGSLPLEALMGPRASPAKGGSRGERRCSDVAHISFPAEAAKVRNEVIACRGIRRLGPVYIIGGSGAAKVPASYIERDALFSEAGVEKLNQLARLVDAMDLDAQKVFAGALMVEHARCLDDVLRVAGSLDSYELIPNIKTDEELGRFLVDTGPITGKFIFAEEAVNANLKL